MLEEREFQNNFYPKQISKGLLYIRWYTLGKARSSWRIAKFFCPFSGLAESMQWKYRQTIAGVNGWVSIRNCYFLTKHQQMKASTNQQTNKTTTAMTTEKTWKSLTFSTIFLAVCLSLVQVRTVFDLLNFFVRPWEWIHDDITSLFTKEIPLFRSFWYKNFI